LGNFPQCLTAAHQYHPQNQGSDSSPSPIADAVVTFTPVGGFYELQISLDGNVISAVLSKAAVRAGREARQTKAATSGV